MDRCEIRQGPPPGYVVSIHIHLLIRDTASVRGILTMLRQEKLHASKVESDIAEVALQRVINAIEGIGSIETNGLAVELKQIIDGCCTFKIYTPEDRVTKNEYSSYWPIPKEFQSRIENKNATISVNSTQDRPRGDHEGCFKDVTAARATAYQTF